MLGDLSIPYQQQHHREMSMQVIEWVHFDLLGELDP